MAKSKVIFIIFLTLSLAKQFHCKENDKKIINGFPATRGQFPYMVSLQYPIPKEHECGGSLLTTSHVITAAHCVDPTVWHLMLVVAGTINHRNWDAGTQTQRIKSRLYPGKYPTPGNIDDVAILITVRKFTETKYIKPLPYKLNEVKVDDEVIIMGWGYTENPPLTKPDILQWGHASINKFPVCGKDLKPVDENMFVCVRGNANVTIPRAANSGSPGVYDGGVFGVVSQGIPFGYYGVLFTRLSHYDKWIKTTLQSIEAESNGERVWGPLSYAISLSLCFYFKILIVRALFSNMINF